jgi:acetate---CoA ligase (ADP-forming) subunit alpha
MPANIEDHPLFRLANPRSIAFWGASGNFVSMGSNLLLSLRGIGFEGPIYPVHPKETEIQGLKAYPRVDDLPEIPDLAIMVLPTGVVNPTLKECGEKGIKNAIVVSGGFKEVGGDGIRLEKELRAIAREYGIRVLGPNCLGVANPRAKLNTTFIPHEGAGGFIGLASQSGSYVTQMFDYLHRLNLGFSTAFSVGNQADIDLVDCLEYLGDCPHTRVIALYVEGIDRGRQFVETARAITPHKPIVAYYVGGSDTGRRAGLSHTGALAGPDALYTGIFRQAGIIRAETITELFDFCWTLGRLPEPKGQRVVIQTHSGGPGAAGADACGRAGLELPPLGKDTLEKLKAYVPHTGSINNPVDLTFSRNQNDFYTDIPKLLIQSPDIDMVMFYFLTPEPIIHRFLANSGVPEDDIPKEVNAFIDQAVAFLIDVFRSSNKPLVGYTWRSLEERFSQGLMAGGMPLFEDPDRAARALAALVRYKEYKERIIAAATVDSRAV